MKSLMRVALVSGGLVACNFLAWTTMTGCSGDDNKDGGTDSGPDVTVDSGKDAGPDAMPDVVDASDGDAPYDAKALQAFPMQEATAICQRLQSCCFNDAGTGSMTACENFWIQTGWEGNLSEVYQNPALLDGGNLRLDTTAATSCLAGLATVSCGILNIVDGGGSTMTATENKALIGNCYGAIYGAMPQGAEGCRAAVECVPGSDCTPATGSDGGATTKCTAVLGSGQGPCGTNNNWACEYRGNVGTTALACQSTDAGTKCGTPLANGSACVHSWECSSDFCNAYANFDPVQFTVNPACANSGPWWDPISCDTVFGVDGGP
jgi:hypothetical protein